MTSRRGSYFATVSPGCFSQRPIVPSATLSPSCGIVTLATGSVPPLGRCAWARGTVGPSVAHPARACARSDGCGFGYRRDPGVARGSARAAAVPALARGGPNVTHPVARRRYRVADGLDQLAPGRRAPDAAPASDLARAA